MLAFIRTGSQLGQEHAARAIWHLAALTESQKELVECNAVPDLVQLLKLGDAPVFEFFEKQIYIALYTKTTQLNNAVHILAHS